MSQMTRRFSLGDLMIMIAAIAASIMGMRSLWLGHLAGRGVIASKQMTYDRLLVAAMLSACATPLTVACLAFRIRRPRPAWRRVAIRPGTAAMLACVVIFAARTLEVTASLISPDVYSFAGLTEFGRASPIQFGDSVHVVLIRSMNREGVIGSIEPFGCHSTLVASFASPCGPAVAAVWLVLALSGRWRPEKSWIDRLGRLLGAMWIMISALAAIPV
jgi:hypothetical protein